MEEGGSFMGQLAPNLYHLPAEQVKRYRVQEKGGIRYILQIDIMHVFLVREDGRQYEIPLEQIGDELDVDPAGGELQIIGSLGVGGEILFDLEVNSRFVAQAFVSGKEVEEWLTIIV